MRSGTGSSRRRKRASPHPATRRGSTAATEVLPNSRPGNGAVPAQTACAGTQFRFPHPGPLPEGEGTLRLVTVHCLTPQQFLSGQPKEARKNFHSWAEARVPSFDPLTRSLSRRERGRFFLLACMPDAASQLLHALPTSCIHAVVSLRERGRFVLLPWMLDAAACLSGQPNEAPPQYSWVTARRISTQSNQNVPSPSGRGPG
jgi:hypothetical protein